MPKPKTVKAPHLEKESDVKSPIYDIDEVNIEGTLLMLDDATPHVAVVVQAVSPAADDKGEPTVVATMLSDEVGKYQFLNLKPGRYQVRCYTLDGYVYYQNREILQVERGKILRNVDFRFAPFKKGTWKTITYLDGLADNAVYAIHGDSNGMIWFGTQSGVSRYDGKTFTNFTTEDGLAGNRVNTIYCDADGILWFGTNEGVSRYDGNQFLNLTTEDGLVGNYVNAIYHDADDALWFGTSEGVSCYDGKTFSNFTRSLATVAELATIQTDSRSLATLATDGLANNDVRDICRHPDGSLWFATAGGVSRYDGRAFVSFTRSLATVAELATIQASPAISATKGLVGDEVNVIYCDADGILWFGAGLYDDNGGVSRYDGKGFINFTQKDGLAGDRVTAIHRDPDGVMWFGIYGFSKSGRGVSRYDGTGFVNFAVKDGLADERVSDIYCDADGAIWFATYRSGVCRYSPSEFVNFTTKDGLADNDIRVVYHHPDGCLWCGTGSGGVSRYDGKSFVNFTEVGKIYHGTDGKIWFEKSGNVSRYSPSEFVNSTTKDGVSWYDGGTFLRFSTEDGLPNAGVRDIYRDADGALWFATAGGGISRYDGREFVNFFQKSGREHNNVQAICGAPDGAIWFGTDGTGVYRYDRKSFVNFTLATDGLAYDRVSVIHCDVDGVIWFGTFGGGVSRYDGKSFVNFTRSLGISATDGLAGADVWEIYRDADGVIWFGTNGGVSCYTAKEGSKGRFVNFIRSLATSDTVAELATIQTDSRNPAISDTDGLVNNKVISIYRDSDSVMWFGTFGGGVCRYNAQQGCWASLDTRDGLAGNRVTSIHQEADGSLWFATDGGMTRYRPSLVPPKVRIASITTGQTYRDLDAIPAFTVGTRVTIAYSAIDFKTVPEKRQYRYRIKEIDKDWRSPTKASTFDYIFERAGSYTFAVQAIDRDLNYSESATVNLTIQPDPKFVAMQTELNDLRREVSRKYQFENLIGESAAIREVHALMERAIDSGLAVLITGETGTGKELVAKAIHFNSPRQDKPLKEINCGAIARDLVASALFGHRKGVFTGAHEDRMGLFEEASGGSVLLDEIGDMPEDAQIHLLRVLQERKIQRVGETELRDVDVRVIAITNRDLMDEVAAGRFREDLYYRVSGFPIHVPPLRERADDIPLLAEHFLRTACHNQDKELDGFAPGVMEMLQSYPWPGNVRQLQLEIYRAVAFTNEGSRIQTYHFSPRVTQGESLIQEVLSEQVNYRELVDRFRRRVIEEALRENNGNRSATARQLGMDRANLVNTMKRLGIQKKPISRVQH